MAGESMIFDHILEELIEGGAVALCGQRASAIHPLMFGTGKRGAPQCPDCMNVALARSEPPPPLWARRCPRTPHQHPWASAGRTVRPWISRLQPRQTESPP